MKLSVDRGEFLEALQKAKTATERKTALPILNNFLLVAEDDKLFCKATDLENFLTFSIRAVILQEGACTVNADKLTSVVRSIPSVEIQMEVKEDKLVLTGGRSVFKLTTLNPEDFPEFPKIKVSTSISSGDLLKAIDKTEYAVSKEDSRYALQGLYLHEHQGKTHFVGSDGHRLALYWTNSSFPLELLLPRKSLKVLESLLKDYIGHVEVGRDESFSHMKGEGWELSIRLLEGEYPDYISIIPKEFNHQLLIDRQAFIESLKRLSSVASSSAFPIKVSLANDLMILEISEPEYGEGKDELEVEYSDEPVELGFNGRYLIEALESFDIDKVWFKITDSDSAVLIESSDPEQDPYICIIMPMRL
ncbi:MAG: DNA polymerase III subunit beta [Aquificaceae bacterium]